MLWSKEGTTQGDPCAMAMYAISVVPLIDGFKEEEQKFKQVWFADDATGGGTLEIIRKWWEYISDKGKHYGYYANAKKTILIVKPEHVKEAEVIFKGTNMTIKTGGTRHLGSIIGLRSSVEEYVKEKVSRWTKEVDVLSTFAGPFPQLAYAQFVFGLKSKWNYILRTTPNISHLMKPLEDSIRDRFIPSIIGKSITNEERDLLSLPLRHGGMGISNPIAMCDKAFNQSLSITNELVKIIYEQKRDYADFDDDKHENDKKEANQLKK